MEFVYKIDNAIPSSLCKSIIEKFKVDPNKKVGEVTGLNDSYIPDLKKCTDLWLDKSWLDERKSLSMYTAKAVTQYFQHLQKNVLSIDGVYINNSLTSSFTNIIPSGFQLQHYKKGGVFKWHSDDSPYEKRLLAYIMYLNTVPIENGGTTDFLHGKSIQPTEGSILFFPSTWSYIHRGGEMKCGDKYIITGFVIQSNLKFCPDEEL